MIVDRFPASSWEEIGQALGLRVDQVRHAFYDGMEKLRKLPPSDFRELSQVADEQRAVIDRIEDWKSLGE